MNTQKKKIALKKVTNACTLCHAKDLCMTSCLNQDDLKRFKDVIGHRTPMERGERLFMAGDDIKCLFVLHSGSVKSYVESSDGDNQITGFHLPGDVIGIHGVEDKVHTDTVEALETSSVCEIRFANLEDIGQAFPNLRKKLMRCVFREMSHEQDMMLVLGKMSAERRIAYFLLDIASRLEEHGLSAKRLNLTMPRHDIANYLGLAGETVSRILTRFQSADIIEVKQRAIVIKERLHLEAIFDNQESDLSTQPSPNHRVNR